MVQECARLVAGGLRQAQRIALLHRDQQGRVAPAPVRLPNRWNFGRRLREVPREKEPPGDLRGHCDLGNRRDQCRPNHRDRSRRDHAQPRRRRLPRRRHRAGLRALLDPAGFGAAQAGAGCRQYGRGRRECLPAHRRVVG